MLHVVAYFMPHVFACCIFHAARFCMLQVERALHAETHGDLSAAALVHCAAQEFVEVDIGALLRLRAGCAEPIQHALWNERARLLMRRRVEGDRCASSAVRRRAVDRLDRRCRRRFAPQGKAPQAAVS